MYDTLGQNTMYWENEIIHTDDFPPLEKERGGGVDWGETRGRLPSQN